MSIEYSDQPQLLLRYMRKRNLAFAFNGCPKTLIRTYLLALPLFSEQ